MLLALSCVALQLGPPVASRTRTPPPLLQIRPGGDLEGGLDDQRNADISALKKLFYETEATAVTGESARKRPEQVQCEEASKLGIYLDIPLARWSMTILPYQQVLLNVFQPEYVHMFETLLASPKPWLYLHVHLPGGITNLGNPEYSLPGVPDLEASPKGSRAALDGTLMKVVDVQRQPDARLALIVQGLGRAHVLQGTQALPYARANIQLLPDAEALSASARKVKRWLEVDHVSKGVDVNDSIWRRLVMAAAVGEERNWWAYETKPVRIGRTLPPAFCSFNPAEADVATRVDAAVRSAISDAPMAPFTGDETKGEEEDELYTTSEPVRTALQIAVDGVRSESEPDEEDSSAKAHDGSSVVVVKTEEEREEEERLLALEIQVWIEFDALLRRIAATTDTPSQVPAPAQLLSLLPPAPAAGWPKDFILDKIVVELRRRASEQRANPWYNEEDDTEPYMPYISSYPPRRRTQRLSYSIWSAVRDGESDHQAILETSSTSDRMRAILLRLREVAARLDAD